MKAQITVSYSLKLTRNQWNQNKPPENIGDRRELDSKQKANKANKRRKEKEKEFTSVRHELLAELSVKVVRNY